MSFRNNGSKRNIKYVLSSIFMLVVGILCIVLAARSGWKFSSTVIGLIITFLGVLMFKNANEV